jgi:hypothetical protein
MDFANNSRDLIGAFDELDRDLRIAVDLRIYETLLQEFFGLRNGQAIQLDDADKGQQNAAIRAKADLRVVVDLLEDVNRDEVASSEPGVSV